MEEVSIKEIVQEAQEKEIKYYANVDGNGKLIGWYNTDIHNEDAIPAPKIEVTKEAWQNAIDNGHNKVNEDGTTKLFDFRTNNEKAEQAKYEQRSEIERQLSKLTVTSSKGNVFDANSQSRQNMSDAILASGTLGITQTVWRMADNSDVQIGISELKEAHALAIKMYSEIKGIGV